METNFADGYSIGYGKPAVESQFKKGRSGNPFGRPKANGSLQSDFERELNKRVFVKENGKDRWVTKREALTIQTVNKAINGDRALVKDVLSKISQIDERAAIDESQQENKRGCWCKYAKFSNEEYEENERRIKELEDMARGKPRERI